MVRVNSLQLGKTYLDSRRWAAAAFRCLGSGRTEATVNGDQHLGMGMVDTPRVEVAVPTALEKEAGQPTPEFLS